MAQMTDEQLAELNYRLLQDAANYLGEEVMPKRKRNREYYDGQNPETLRTMEGRSKVVDNLVKDTIEWIMPSLIRVFNSGDKIISIEGHDDADIEHAETVEAWVNYVESRMNPGFLNDYTWFKNALIERDGWEKVFWKRKETVARDDYEGLTPDLLAELKADENYEVLSEEEYAVDVMDDVTGEKLRTARLTAVTGNRVTEEWCLRIEVLEPDAVLFLEEMTGDRESWWFVSHKGKKRISELRELGFEVPDDINGPELDQSEQIRTYDQLQSMRTEITDDDLGALDPSLREVWVYESFIKTDADDDGIAEWNKVVQVGDTILAREQEPEPNLFHITPVIRPHRLSGEGAADLVAELQDLMTALNRQILDNIYLSNNPRPEMDKSGMSAETWNDYHNSKIGHPIRVKRAGTVNYLQNPQLQPWTFNLLEYWEGKRENRAGVTRYNQGLDANSLNKTATGVVQIMQSAMQRIELIARILAETGVKDKMRYIIETSARYPEYVEERSIRLQGRKLNLNASDLQGRYDLVINPAVGTGNKQETLQNVMLLMDFYERAAAAGLGPGSEQAVFAVNNLFNASREMIKAMGWRNTGDFVIDPKGDNAKELRDPVQPPQPNPDVIKAQADAEKARGDLALRGQDIKQDGEEKQMELRLKAREVAVKEREVAVEEQRLGIELAQVQQGVDPATRGEGGANDAGNVIDVADRLEERRLEERKLAMEERKTDAEIAKMAREGAAAGAEQQQAQEAMAALEELKAKMDAPKVFHRDAFGEVVAIDNAPVIRDENGLIIGIGPENEEAANASNSV